MSNTQHVLYNLEERLQKLNILITFSTNNDVKETYKKERDMILKMISEVKNTTGMT